MKSGIYRITNTMSGKCYVGSAQHLVKRWSYHRWHLQGNKHPNQYLQNSWNKHGESNFKFEILLHCPENELIIREQEYIDSLKSEYNIRKIATSNLGMTWSTDRTRAQGLKRKGKKRPDVSEQMKGNKYACDATHSVERRKKLSSEMRAKFSKAVIAKGKDGEVISEHTSGVEAGLCYGLDRSNVAYSCRHGSMIRKMGLYFEYKD